MFNPDDSTDMTSTLNGEKYTEHYASRKIVLSYRSLEELNRSRFLFIEFKIARFRYGRKKLKIFVVM